MLYGRAGGRFALQQAYTPGRRGVGPLPLGPGPALSDPIGVVTGRSTGSLYRAPGTPAPQIGGFVACRLSRCCTPP